MVSESKSEVAISVNWPLLIGREMLDQFKHGVINAHAGDLPRFRGNACPNWAVLLGETRVVVTLHRMVPGLDAGPVLLQREFPLDSNTYLADVYRFMDYCIPPMFVEVLDGLASGRVRQREQPRDPKLSLRCFPRMPRDSEIDWQQPADELARLVRASAEPFGGAYTYWGTERLIVWRARVEVAPYPFSAAPGQVMERLPEIGIVLVATGYDVLALEEVEIEGRGRGPATKVIRSLRTRFGMDVTGEIARLRREITDLKKR
jgi:UDP-4-amino-4-deoxy-L-arabinose formyltransferase/UDP-glucuronic acid dehydrogenase (UDP-4-keto-hexauronic acid decarboxylating)